MARRARRDIPGSFFHVINRSVRNVPIFMNRSDYRAFLTVLEEGLTHHPVKLISYCVMPNHWHLVLGPNGPNDLSPFMQWVTATHAIRWHRHHKSVGQGPVYQRLFRSEPVEAAGDLVNVCRYVERNALRSRLVRRAQDWPWCSLSDRRRGDATLPLQPAVFLASDAWLDYVNAVVTTRERVEASDPLLSNSNDPSGLAGLFQDGEDLVRHLTAHDHHEPDSHVERSEHLGLGDAAGALEPGEERWHHPALAIK
jgi:putative transposase